MKTFTRHLVTAALVAAAIAAPGAAYAAGGNHAHKAGRGGLIAMVQKYHFELVPEGAKGFKVYLMDYNLKQLPIAGVSGVATVELDGQRQTVRLMPMGDHLHGMPDISKAKRLRALVTLSVNGQALDGRFSKQ